MRRFWTPALGLCIAVAGCQGIGSPEPESGSTGMARRGKGIAAQTGPAPQPRPDPTVDKSTLVIDGMPPSNPHGIAESKGDSSMRVTPTGAPPRYGRAFAVVEPRRDEPAESTKHVYRDFKVGSVAVEGVCSIVDGPVSCWGTDGKRNSALETKVAEAIRRQTRFHTNLMPTATIGIGRKNRLIVAKITPTTPSKGNISVYSLEGQTQSIGTNLALATRSSGPDAPRYEMRIASVRPDAKEASIRLIQTEPIPALALVDCRAGAKASLDGTEFRMVTLERDSVLRPPLWRFRIVRSVKGEGLSLGFTAIDTVGERIQGLLDDGTPVTPAEVRRMSAPPALRNPITLPNRILDAGEDSISGLLHLDPAKIGKLEIRASRFKFVDVTGIPMDPRK